MTTATERMRRWERWVSYLPLVTLAAASAVALPTSPAFGLATPGWLTVQVVLVLTAAWWSWWWTLRRPEWRQDRRLMAVHIIGRIVLAFVLTWINPFFAIFAWTGFIDVADAFEGWSRRLLMLVVAGTVAGSQSGGLPPASGGQWLAFGVLLLVNYGLVAFFGRLQIEMERHADEQSAMITELERVNAELERALAENADLHETVVAQAHVAGVQEERQRLAREIHDTIAQTLAAGLAQLQAAATDPDPRARLARATDLTREALAEARRSVLDLAPAPLSDGGGLADVVTRLVTAWSQEHQASAEAVVTGDTRPLHPEVEATVLRITQEALSNVAKHAGAERVGVTLTYGDDEVILDVRDDGAGFDERSDPAQTSFGLRGMRQRAERLAGVLDVETQPGAGTAVSLRLPALDREAAA